MLPFFPKEMSNIFICGSLWFSVSLKDCLNLNVFSRPIVEATEIFLKEKRNAIVYVYSLYKGEKNVQYIIGHISKNI